MPVGVQEVTEEGGHVPNHLTAYSTTSLSPYPSPFVEFLSAGRFKNLEKQ